MKGNHFLRKKSKKSRKRNKPKEVEDSKRGNPVEKENEKDKEVTQ